jgi:formylglycine-generating enzyme required for sulfatase activity
LAGQPTLLLWDIPGSKLRKELVLPDHANDIAFAADGRHIATANANGTVYLFRLPDELPLKALTAEQVKQQQENEAKGLGVPVQMTNSVGMKLNLIPPGRFLMGSPENEPGREGPEGPSPGVRGREGPQHEVAISKAFYLGAHEVTVGQFRAFVKATGHQTEAEKDGAGSWRSMPDGSNKEDPTCTWLAPAFSQTDQHPVVCVSWNDAMAFCNWLSREEGHTYRLPTEAEWEYACRAGTTTPFSCGTVEDVKEVANLADASLKRQYPGVRTDAWDDGHPFSAPVGQFRPNGFGLYDMHGNVWEWVADWYDQDYFANSPRLDPQGPATGTNRVLRGGSWYNDARHARSARRNGDTPPQARNNGIGFRVVREMRPEAESGK